MLQSLLAKALLCNSGQFWAMLCNAGQCCAPRAPGPIGQQLGQAHKAEKACHGGAAACALPGGFTACATAHGSCTWGCFRSALPRTGHFAGGGAQRGPRRLGTGSFPDQGANLCPCQVRRTTLGLTDGCVLSVVQMACGCAEMLRCGAVSNADPRTDRLRLSRTCGRASAPSNTQVRSMPLSDCSRRGNPSSWTGWGAYRLSTSTTGCSAGLRLDLGRRSCTGKCPAFHSCSSNPPCIEVGPRETHGPLVKGWCRIVSALCRA